MDGDELVVTFAGSGDAFGNGGRFQACLHLRPPSGGPLLVDCGATSLVALKRLGLDPNEVGTVVVSHLHGDHFGGLPFLVLDGQFAKRTRPLTVVGPQGVQERLRQAMEVFYPGSSTIRRAFDLTVVELDGSTRVDGVDIAAWEVDHPSGAPALALRLTIGGRTLAYTGDTAWTDVIAAAAHEADLLVAECYFYDKPVPYHLSHADLIRHRDELTARRIVLTHLSGDVLGRLDEVAFEVASDGLTLTL